MRGGYPGTRYATTWVKLGMHTRVKKLIILYIQLRLFYEGKIAKNAFREEYVRYKFHKIIHFKHQ